MWPITPSVQGSNIDATHIKTFYIILSPVGSLVYESGSKAAGELPVMLSHVFVGGLPGNDTLSRRLCCQVALWHTHALPLFVCYLWGSYLYCHSFHVLSIWTAWTQVATGDVSKLTFPGWAFVESRQKGGQRDKSLLDCLTPHTAPLAV